ncbi:tetratricopeptide repeat protein [Leptolyngbyaceae cyanobacterium CCMR0082]|uniref:Tetratricopeptide repeat protein n=1 Tax=Adonisia turfae CCMR0082 TaxID=2304604 RepID=A0A6M0SA10_9CYAN|nr:tetratricopeptide repeat protein [Adonisia turfae CCMR0082]
MAIAALAGMGGIGKTALAQQYVREAKAEYPGGRWYFKVRDQGLVTQLVNAATIFGWQLPDGLTDDRARAQWCYERWCRQYPGPRLLLLDDVPQYRDIRDFLPAEDASFRVLMTSRRRFGRPVERVDLGLLPLDEAIALMVQLMGDENRVRAQQTEAEELCEWVGRLPLGVELVARYLALHPTITFAKLQERLHRKRLETKALKQASAEVAYDQIEEYEEPIKAAFELSWQDLKAEAKTLMGVLSIFAAAPIPQGLIAGALPEWDEEDLEEVLDGVLVQRNSLQSDADGSYQLHQLIREFTVGKLETELSDQTSALQKSVADSLVNFAKRIEQIVTVSAQQVVGEAIPHMELVARELSHVIEDSTNATWPFVGLGRFYQSQSLWPETEHWWQSCLTMTEERFGPDHPDTALSLNNLGGLYNTMGRYEDAEPIFQRSLAIREAQLGPDHPDTALSLNNLGLLYDTMGRYEDAEPLFQRSLAISEAQLGPDHPDTALSLNNLAMFLYGLERYAESANCGVKALVIFLAKLGQDHPNTQTVGNNFIAILQKVIETNQTQQLDHHPLTQTILKNLLSNSSE